MRFAYVALCAAMFLGRSATAAVGVTLGWYNLQWPPSTTTDVGIPTANIYGQVWADGFTNLPGQGAGILAQLGFGPPADMPSQPSWSWTNMVYNVDVGNNDEYMGNIVPTQAGTFAYTTRFSGDGGVNWLYADLDGPNYDIGRGGVLTVTPEPATLTLAGLIGVVMLPRRRR